MALAHYRDQFWFPSGALAANIPARIFPLQSNILAPIYTDVTGTTPLPNPLSTDGIGFLDFWAEEGEYWINIDSRSFRVAVGTPDALDVFEIASVAASTGIVWGGTMAPSGTSVSFGETVGYVVNYTTDAIRPTLTRVHKTAQTVALDAPALARTLTWWLLSSAGAFVQQATAPTRTQRRTHIVLGYSIFFAGTVAYTNAVPQYLPQPYNDRADLVDTLGPYIIDGGVMSPNGVNLSFNLTALSMFSRSYAADTNPNDPSVANLAAHTPAQWRYAISTQTVFSPTTTTLIDPANYESGGVLVPVPGGSNTSTIQRVFVFAQDNAPDQLAVQYGQRTYTSLAAAVAGVGVEAFTVNPLIIGALVGWICVIKSATDLSNSAQAAFVPATAKFARP
jgi:hypothetical protein